MASSSLVQLHEQALNGLLFLWAYFTPAVSFFGIAMNLVTCITMPFTTLSRKARFFYTTLAFFDIGPLIFHNVFMFSGFGLLYATNGSAYAQIEAMSNTLCLLHRAALRSSESIANSVLALFALERMYAIRFPFQAHVISFSKTLAAIAAISLVNSAAIWSGTFNLYALEGSALGVARYCNPQISTSGRLLLTVFVDMLMPYIVPTVLTTTFNTVTIITLIQRRRNMKNDLFERHAISKSEVSNAFVVIIISFAHFVTAIPYSTLFFASLLGTGLIYSLLRVVGNYFVVFLGVIHAANFVIYLLRLKSFRDVVLCRKNFCHLSLHHAGPPKPNFFISTIRPIHRSISITGLTRFTYAYCDAQAASV